MEDFKRPQRTPGTSTCHKQKQHHLKRFKCSVSSQGSPKPVTFPVCCLWPGLPNLGAETSCPASPFFQATEHMTLNWFYFTVSLSYSLDGVKFLNESWFVCVFVCVCVYVCVFTTHNAGGEVVIAWLITDKMIPRYFIDNYLVSACLVSAPKVKMESIVKLIAPCTFKHTLPHSKD